MTTTAAQQAAEAWSKALEAVADAQSEFLERVLSEPANAELANLVRRWTDLQREVLAGWLALAGRPDRVASLAELQAAGAEMAESLRAAAERLVASQGEWARAWADAS